LNCFAFQSIANYNINYNTNTFDKLSQIGHKSFTTN
jgi:hypothetical protein